VGTNGAYWTEPDVRMKRRRSAGVPPPFVVLVEGWRDLVFVAGADDAAEHDGEDRGDDDPGEQGNDNPVHNLDNGPTRLFVTGG